MNPSRGQGVHGSGARTFTEQQQRTVEHFLNLHPGWRTVEELSEQTGLPGRMVREIISERDGIDYLVETGNKGYRLVTTVAAAEESNRRLMSQVVKMQERVNRRQQYVIQHLTNGRQNELF